MSSKGKTGSLGTSRNSENPNQSISPDQGPVQFGFLRRFVKGAASGLLSGALLQPLQVIKTSMQVSPQEKAKYIDGKVAAK